VMSLPQMASESAALLKLGLAFMASGLLMTGAAYAVRTIVLRHSGLEAAGIYYAAWTLGGLYLGFVLQSLGTDFYPRLVGVAHDDEACNRMVNEQAQVSLLLAMPGVLFTLVVAPLVLTLFYSAKFTPAADTLRWICLGMALRVLNWPLGYVVVAKNRQVLFFSIEVAWVVVNVTLTWWCVQALGVAGAGVAFLGANVFHGLIIYPIVRHLSGFRWTAVNVATAWFFLGLITAVFVALQTLPAMVAIPLALVATAGSTWFSVRTLVHLTAAERLPASIRRLLRLGAGA
jgi:antigen flippase